MNIGKVIVTCFVPRGQRPSHGTTHAQNLPSPDSVLQMIKRTVETEKRIDAGMPMDTIIVNNDEGFIDGREFLDSINETPTKNGHFKVMHRENYGRSFILLVVKCRDRGHFAFKCTFRGRNPKIASLTRICDFS